VILRFLDPTSGGVSIGDSPLESMAGDEVRRHVTLLDQHPMLFGGSLRDALRLGAPDATDDELLEVLRRCQLTALTGVGADGSPLDLMIGEDGSTLSGGQQRRVGLARALLRRPDVLLLDEPTAGLSALQGSEILATCLDAARESTVILVTHDVDHAAGFDQILWLEEGRLTPLSNERIAQLRR
jgi:ABC-type transport system involved in cytochrome bd biosynthesis fused ATPase/permease subunit